MLISEDVVDVAVAASASDLVGVADIVATVSQLLAASAADDGAGLEAQLAPSDLADILSSHIPSSVH